MNDELNNELRNAKEHFSESISRLQLISHSVDETKMNLLLQNRESQRRFLQKVGDLSFVFGAAIVPVIVASKSKEEIDSFWLVLVGVGLYLINGFIALWKNKSLIEQDANDIPYVGITEEIKIRPVINSLRKLVFNSENVSYRNEYISASLNATALTEESLGKKEKINFWPDIVTINFVIASVFIVKAVWSFNDWIYWIIFAGALIFMLSLTAISYVRSRESQIRLAQKKKELQKIDKEYKDWHNQNVLGKRDD